MRIAGGTVVTAEGARIADVVLEGGRIAGIEAGASEGDLDARGCVVLPGGVDPHTHLLVDVVPATRSALHAPRSGALAVGADADLVVWDPAAPWTVAASDLHDGLGSSPYDGIRVDGRIRAVVRGGRRVE